MSVRTPTEMNVLSLSLVPIFMTLTLSEYPYGFRLDCQKSFCVDEIKIVGHVLADS